MKSMLILTDFSEAAFRAAEYACELVSSLHIKRIVLYHAYRTALTATDLPAETVVSDNKQIYMDSLESLGMLHDRLKPMVEKSVIIDMLAGDSALIDMADLIREQTRKENIDMIVMGVSGKSGLEKLLLGNTTATVLRTSELPVLIIPEDIPLGKAINSVVFASDLKEVAAIPTLSLFEFLNIMAGKLYVVNVEDKAEEKYSPETEKAITGLHELLGSYDPSFHYIKGEDTVEEILAFAEQERASLIIAVHQKHGFWSRLFHTSITKKLAYNSKVPLLALPAVK